MASNESEIVDPVSEEKLLFPLTPVAAVTLPLQKQILTSDQPKESSNCILEDLAALNGSTSSSVAGSPIKNFENNNLNLDRGTDNNKPDAESVIFTGPDLDNANDLVDESDDEKEAEEILDKRLVEGTEPWYLIKWKNFDHVSNTWEPVDALKCPQLIAEYEESLANQDPDAEFLVDEVCGKKEIDGELYYFVKWRGYPDSSNTWEPAVNIYAKDKIEEFENKFKATKESKAVKRRKIPREDPDYGVDTELYDAVKVRTPRGRTTTRSGRISNPPVDDIPADLVTSVGKKRGRKPKPSSNIDPVLLGTSFMYEDGINETYDDFYEKLNVRVPPCTYDTSDFDNAHLFYIRMSNYLSWIVLEHHIHHFDHINKMTKNDRRAKLSQRLQLYKMKVEMSDIIMSRELGVWEAILCMNQAQRKLEYDKMRRFLRDNESIPIPADWNIMKFIASIDKRRRKQFGFDTKVAPKPPPKAKPVAKKRKYTKKKPLKKSPAKKKKVESDYEEDDYLSEPDTERDIEKEMDEELGKKEDDDDKNDSDYDAELEQMLEKSNELKSNESSFQNNSDILAQAAHEAQIDSIDSTASRDVEALDVVESDDHGCQPVFVGRSSPSSAAAVPSVAGVMSATVMSPPVMPPVSLPVMSSVPLPVMSPATLPVMSPMNLAPNSLSVSDLSSSSIISTAPSPAVIQPGAITVQPPLTQTHSSPDRSLLSHVSERGSIIQTNVICSNPPKADHHHHGQLPVHVQPISTQPKLAGHPDVILTEMKLPEDFKDHRLQQFNYNTNSHSYQNNQS